MASFAASASMLSVSSYLRRVYAWLFVGVLLSGLGGFVALNVGTPVPIDFDGTPVTVAPVVAAFVAHPVIAMLVLFALVIFAGAARKVPGVQAVAFFLFTAFAGAFIAPLITYVQLRATHGLTVTAHPVRDAFLLTTAAFGSLSAYAIISKRDFSFLRGFLWVGLMTLIAAMFVGLFLGSRPYDLAISSVSVLVFSGFILFDTSTVLRKSTRDDAIGDALNLYLDVLNLFVNLLSILGGGSDKR